MNKIKMNKYEILIIVLVWLAIILGLIYANKVVGKTTTFEQPTVYNNGYVNSAPIEPKKIAYYSTCPECNATGYIECDFCKGNGMYYRAYNLNTSDARLVLYTCYKCNGTGRLVCPTCKGKGGITVYE